MLKKNRAPARNARPGAGGSAPSLEVRARQALDANRHREAIELYKELLKQEQRPEWVDGLAASYAGRAGELAAKGMLPEALVVWRNRSSLCGKPLAEGPYVDWLLRVGEFDAALRLLTTVQDAAAGSDLETRLAAVALTAPDSALAPLAAEHPLRRHRPAALAALAACCRGDQADLDEQLRAIPFRSPYRDLRFILKSLLLVVDDLAQAGDLIARVAADGPFERLAAVVRAAVLPGNGWLLAIRDLDDVSRRLLLDLKGCPENRVALLLEVAELARVGASPAPAKVVDLLLRRSRGLPASAAWLCRRLLPFADKRIADYRNAFGALAEAERECLLARGSEIHNQGHAGEAHWLNAARLLSEPEAAPLQAALILRHLFEVTVGNDPASDYDRECTHWLERSLVLDPDDRATHLKLIRIHRQDDDLKSARECVEKALALFPNDAAVLLEAVETALAGNAFKKAVTLAKRLLKLDPINSRVRALIGQAHLAHARKQIRAQRPEAATKEIELAEEWLTAANERSIAKLLRGLSAGDAEASALLRAAAAELGGKLLAAFHALLESLRVGGTTSGVLRRAGIDLSAMATPREVVAVVHAANALGEADRRRLQTVFDSLRAPLTRAAGADFSESERIAVCEAALRHNESALLRAYADAGLKHWPERPIFVYFATFARHGASARTRMSDRERQQVENALDQARADGDQRTLLRLGELMRPKGLFGGSIADEFDEFDDFDDDDDFGESADNLPVDLSAFFELLIKMGGHNELIRVAREAIPADLFRQLERSVGGNQKKLAQLLIEHAAGMGPSAASPANQLPAPKPRRPAPRAKPAPPPVGDDSQKGLFDD